MSAAGGGGGERQESKRGALRALNIIDHCFLKVVFFCNIRTQEKKEADEGQTLREDGKAEISTVLK